jgi:Asp-tRNA(Asn)/Glu-tRNA(Gln) amidotransferase A subunit family amidase
MHSANQLSATDALREMQKGTLSCEQLVTACLERITQRDPSVGAWAFYDAESALAQARRLDREPIRGILHGIPIGVKDVLDTADLPTQYNSPIYRGHRPRSDAAAVALARSAGAIILGKTATTEFATREPCATRNPHDLNHSPGGSSSGSAASVADCMVPLGIGTQTAGSVIRPASYCGIVGFKPGFNVINPVGMKLVAPSIDTLGVHARTVPDAALLAHALGGLELPDFSRRFDANLRIATVHGLWSETSSETGMLLERAAQLLARAGARVSAMTLPDAFSDLAMQNVISDYEAWRSLAHERIRWPSQLSKPLSEKLDIGGAITRAQYLNIQELASRCRTMIADFFRDYDLILTPAAPGVAPLLSEQSTGNAAFNRLWTVLHLPCINIPGLHGAGGLPLGVQLVGAQGADERLLLAAHWTHRLLAN